MHRTWTAAFGTGLADSPVQVLFSSPDGRPEGGAMSRHNSSAARHSCFTVML
jgi:hypothetical protein